MGPEVRPAHPEVVAEREQAVQIRGAERIERRAAVAQRRDVGSRQQGDLELASGQPAGETPGIGAPESPGRWT
jgi:hypothetical protein